MKNLVALNNKRAKRVGRGPSSGLGKTCGRGMNGQKSKGPVRRSSFTGLRLYTPKKGMKSAKKNAERVFVISELVRRNKEIPEKPTFKSLKKIFNVPHYCRKIKIIGLGENNQVFLRKNISSQA
jgi:large subunit ribosomal protein L15